MNAAKALVCILVFVQLGCASVSKDDIYSLQRQINDLQFAVSNLKRATELDMGRLNSNDSALFNRIQQTESALLQARRKLDSFCVVTKNGKWDEFRSAGDRRCNVQ
jgi:signal transduction histidine kinase